MCGKGRRERRKREREYLSLARSLLQQCTFFREKLHETRMCFSSTERHFSSRLKRACFRNVGPQVRFCPGSLFIKKIQKTFRRDRVETDDTTVERLVELEAHFLRHDHVERKDRVVVVLHMFMRFSSRIRILARRADESEVNALSSSFVVGSSKYKATKC